MKLSDARKQAKENLSIYLLASLGIVCKTAEEVVGHEVVLQLSRRDQIKITNLLTWSEVCCIPLKEVLSVLIEFWKQRFPKKSTRGFGIPIATLTGQKSKEILKVYVQRTYKDRQNIFMRHQSLKEKMLPEVASPEFHDPLDFIEEYKDYISLLRDADAKITRKFQRRKWRNNPFL